MFKNKKVLVVGLATSGIPTVRVLHALSANVTITDLKTEDQISELLKQIQGCYTHALLGVQPSQIEDYDLIVLSPGVPTDLPFIKRAQDQGIEIIGEIELSYRLLTGKFVAITGTNGKTTTTSLLYEMYKAEGKNAYAVGNIGEPPIRYYGESNSKTVFVTEVSSFQLESVCQFRPHVAAILNVTPDHLNRHKTMEAYINAKSKIYQNMGPEDYLILNYDNPITASIEATHTQTVFFSRSNNKKCKVFVDHGTIFAREGAHAVEIIDIEDILIPGPHNVENALAAVAMAYYDDLSLGAIRYALRNFKGVEHRLEPVKTVRGVLYYNDSKGTNPDSTIKAVEAMTKPTYLIAGGMDKGSTFDTLVDAFENRVIHVILYGETKFLIEQTCLKKEFTQISVVDTLEQAVLKAYEMACPGESVLLSPACASLDMYPNYEVRGREFKSIVDGLSTL